MNQNQLNAALCLAVGLGRLDSVKKAIEAGAEINCNKGFPIITSITKKQDAILEYLAPLVDTEKLGKNLFDKAIRQGSTLAVKTFFNEDNLKGSINKAVEYQNIEAVKELLSRMSAPIDSLSDALIAAVKTENLEIINLLVENNVLISKDNDKALRIADEKGNIEIVKFLLSEDAFVDAMVNEPLETSVSRGMNEMTQVLVKAGATITPGIIEMACMTSKEQLILLLEGGADLENGGPSFVSIAIRYGKYDAANVLLGMGVEIDEKENPELAYVLEGSTLSQKNPLMNELEKNTTNKTKKVL